MSVLSYIELELRCEDFLTNRRCAGGNGLTNGLTNGQTGETDAFWRISMDRQG